MCVYANVFLNVDAEVLGTSLNCIVRYAGETNYANQTGTKNYHQDSEDVLLSAWYHSTVVGQTVVPINGNDLFWWNHFQWVFDASCDGLCLLSLDCDHWSGLKRRCWTDLWASKKVMKIGRIFSWPWLLQSNDMVTYYASLRFSSSIAFARIPKTRVRCHLRWGTFELRSIHCCMSLLKQS